MNMFKPVGAKNVEEYMHLLPDDRRSIIETLDTIIREHAPSLTRSFTYNMLGYGLFPYKNYKGEIIQWPIIALASQKNYVSLYVCAVEQGKYVAESYKDTLGNVSVGKSCIRFKRIEDLHMGTLQNLLHHIEDLYDKDKNAFKN